MEFHKQNCSKEIQLQFKYVILWTVAGSKEHMYSNITSFDLYFSCFLSHPPFDNVMGCGKQEKRQNISMPFVTVL